jgi:serine/threonine protein kinase
LQILHKLGEGSYGVVYLARYKLKQVAVKRLASSVFASSIGEFFREATLMMSLKLHPNVLAVYVCQELTNLSLVMEFVSNGALEDILKSGEELDEKTKWNIAIGIAAGMQSLASQNVVHRDLAARNVLLDANLTAKVADFGYARVVDDESGSGQTNANVGPVRWMAPESLLARQYSEKSDVWAYGCVLLELETRKQPWDGKQLVDVAVHVRDTKQHPPTPDQAPEWMKKVMEQCWAPEAADRPTFAQLVIMLEETGPKEAVRARKSTTASKQDIPKAGRGAGKRQKVAVELSSSSSESSSSSSSSDDEF